MTKAQRLSGVMTPCTPEEFDAYIAAYPRPLKRHVTAICEPWQLSYNDSVYGSWPDTVVAFCYVDDYLETDPTKYRIVDGRKETSHRIRLVSSENPS